MAKKTFKDALNPAKDFISTTAEVKDNVKEELVEPKPSPESAVTQVTAEPKPTTKAPEGYKLNPLYVETKSKRLQLLIQPSLLKKVKEKAMSEGKSVNELVHSILQEALKD